MGIKELAPPWATCLLASRGITPDQVEHAAASDVGVDGSIAEEWVAVAQGKVLHLANGHPPALRAELAIAELDELAVENLVSGGLLSAKVGGEHRLICRFSGADARAFGRLARIVNKLKKQEKLEAADTEDAEERMVCPKCGRRYPDKDRRICPKCLDRRSLFRRVLSYLPRYRRSVAAILACMIGAATLRLASPFLGGRIFFDEVLTPGGTYHGRILGVLLVMGAFQLLGFLVDMAYGRISARVAAWVAYDIKTDIFAAMQRLSLGFFSKKQTGGLMTRVNRDAIHLQYFLLDGIPYLVVNSLLAAGIVTVLALMNWRLTLLVIVPGPLIVLVAKRVFPRMWSLFTRQFRRQSALTSLMNDTFTGVRVVKSFGKEDEEVRRFHPANTELYSATLEANRMWASVFPLLQFVMQLGGLAVWAAGGIQVAGGSITFGTLMSFVSYITMLYNPLQFFSNVIEWWAHCMNAAQRIFEIVDTVPEIADAPDAVRVPRIRGDITLRNVTFAYEPNRPVLHDIDLEIKAGEMVGLVGHTGAGKSTLVNLITRLYDAQEGTVEIDGLPIRRIAVEDLREGIGIVLQETYLFSGSVAENIAYSRPGADRDDIIRAAKAANAHDFIVSLPDGYDTVLGRRGADLSGGERQRLSIARALLRDPRVLVFDEATSSVDTETESRIQEAIDRLVKGRTTIAIAHRLSTLRRADRLVILENGKIAEQGTHAELMQKHGAYHKLVHKERQALKIIAVGDS